MSRPCVSRRRGRCWWATRGGDRVTRTPPGGLSGIGLKLHQGRGATISMRWTKATWGAANRDAAIAIMVGVLAGCAAPAVSSGQASTGQPSTGQASTGQAVPATTRTPATATIPPTLGRVWGPKRPGRVRQGAPVDRFQRRRPDRPRQAHHLVLVGRPDGDRHRSLLLRPAERVHYAKHLAASHHRRVRPGQLRGPPRLPGSRVVLPAARAEVQPHHVHQRLHREVRRHLVRLAV